ncbi:MAG: hypothetical protein V1859_10190 [archaeon]
MAPPEQQIPDDLKEIVTRIARDAEDMELRLSEFKFVHSMKMFGIAVGGAVFVLGVLFLLVSVFTFMNVFHLNLEQNVIIAISSTAVVIGVTQIVAGILLIGK